MPQHGPQPLPPSPNLQLDMITPQRHVYSQNPCRFTFESQLEQEAWLDNLKETTNWRKKQSKKENSKKQRYKAPVTQDNNEASSDILHAAEKDAAREWILDEVQMIHELATKLESLSLDRVSLEILTQIESQLAAIRRDLSSIVFERVPYAAQS
ncbi:hypothetical protein FRC03_004485 [Tulasnella sp. 419]|nr:hypothetical protein FRC02_011765 [Tulasnella sp. 418]KAG8962221.1 hypothetical protein FRC03_004485 [Tulasnella sp. 419]